MPRIFPNWLEAYEDYSRDKFVPEQFNTWAGLSVLAGALERRVWLPWSETFAFYPNVFVLLVARPGVGKSVALNKAVDLLKETNRRTSLFNIMPSQVTEAKFIEMMAKGRSFTDNTSGKEMIVFQNAAYYYASEASNSLRNIFGDFIACLTDFYDCPSTWERATKKDGKPITLKNVCLNLLAGSTFDYLGKLVNDESIQGGFASRLLYVVCSEKLVRHQQFQLGLSDEDKAERLKYREALVQDLCEISKVVGPMSADPEFAEAWEKWFPEFEKERQEKYSDKMQSILARTNTNVLKVSMLLSAAESDDRVLKLRHWEKALDLVTSVNKQIPSIFHESRASQEVRGGNGHMISVIINAVKSGKAKDLSSVKQIVKFRFPFTYNLDEVLNGLIEQKILATGAARAGEIELLPGPNADNYF